MWQIPLYKYVYIKLLPFYKLIKSNFRAITPEIKTMSSMEPFAVDGAKRKRRRDEWFGTITEHTELEALALVTNDGLRLAFSCIPDYDVDPDLFSSLSVVVMQSGHDAIDSLGYNRLLEVVLRGTSVFIILRRVGRFFIIGVSRKVEDLDKIVALFRNYSKKIEEKLQNK